MPFTLSITEGMFETETVYIIKELNTNASGTLPKKGFFPFEECVWKKCEFADNFNKKSGLLT